MLELRSINPRYTSGAVLLTSPTLCVLPCTNTRARISQSSGLPPWVPGAAGRRGFFTKSCDSFGVVGGKSLEKYVESVSAPGTARKIADVTRSDCARDTQ